jgi:hypothetical protein
MISNTSKLLAIVSALASAGCTSIPQAGLVYSSTAMVGLGMKVSTADATSPVDIAIGFKMNDFAYVPVAVQESKPVSGSASLNNSVEKISATHTQSTGANPRCDSARKEASDALMAKTKSAAQASAEVAIACDLKQDAMSVYGQFNAAGSATGADRAAGLSAGKIFSTGVAAQNISGSIHLTATTECIKAVTAAFEAATPEVKKTRIDQLCLAKL